MILGAQRGWSQRHISAVVMDGKDGEVGIV
jgi:hypothetical protein